MRSAGRRLVGVERAKEVDRIKVVHVERLKPQITLPPSSRRKMGFQAVEVSFCSMLRNELDAHTFTKLSNKPGYHASHRTKRRKHSTRGVLRGGRYFQERRLRFSVYKRSIIMHGSALMHLGSTACILCTYIFPSTNCHCTPLASRCFRYRPNPKPISDRI